MSHNVETMFSVRQIPWHKLGKILQNPPTSAEAIKEAGLDWKVNLKNIYFENNDNSLSTYLKVPNRKALVRDIDNTPLSIVSNSYKPLQNSEAFDWFDTFVQDGKATYETAGSLLGGKKIWILAKLNDDMEIVDGDTIRRYILLCNGHDGVTSVMIQPTPIRVVCENTLNMSLGTGLVQGIWHHGDIQKKMDRVKKILGLAEQEFESSREAYKDMAKFTLDNTLIQSYVTSLIPDANKDAGEKSVETVNRSRERIK